MQVTEIKMQDSMLFTESAASKVVQLIDEEENSDLRLSIFVQGGNCSGFQYGFRFDELINESKTLLNKYGAKLLVNPISFQYLVGAEIDNQEGLKDAQFVFKNPSATFTCGCRSSFSV